MSVKPSKIKDMKPFPFSEKIAVPDMTAAKRAKMDDFIAACSKAEVEPTKRQAAKYNANYGRWSNSR